VPDSLESEKRYRRRSRQHPIPMLAEYDPADALVDGLGKPVYIDTLLPDNVIEMIRKEVGAEAVAAAMIKATSGTSEATSCAGAIIPITNFCTFPEITYLRARKLPYSLISATNWR